MDWQLPKLHIDPKNAAVQLTGFWRPSVGQSGRLPSSEHPVNSMLPELLSPSQELQLSLSEFCMHIVQITRLTEAERVVHLLAEESGGLGHDVTPVRHGRFMCLGEA
jgi:hypothetical protein